MKILYIYTHNRCRSILSKAITDQIAGNCIVARSAGSRPAGEVHPSLLNYQEKTGYAIHGFRSQSWADYENFQSDVVVTACNDAAGEACPQHIDNGLNVHWGLSDPSKIEGDKTQIERAFFTCIDEIAERVQKLKNIGAQFLESDWRKAAIVEIGDH